MVVLHEFVLHHLISGITLGRGNARGYFDAMERELGVIGRLLALGVADNLLPLLWETQPERFPLAGVVLDLADGVIVHSRYVEARAREAGYDGPIWRIPHPAWPDVAGRAGRDRRRPADRLLRQPEHEQARSRSCSRRSRCCASDRPGARLLLVGAAGERFDLERRLERLGLTARRSCARTTCPRSGCGR